MMWDTAPLGAIFAYNIHRGQYFRALALAFCIGICIFMSSRPFDTANPLPTREDFRKRLNNLSCEERPRNEECPICYEVLDAPAKLPCGRHLLCHDCVERLFGRKYRTHRCPICRTPLFKTRAPWNSLPMKAVVCRAAIGFIKRILELTVLLLKYEPGYPIYHTLRVLNMSALIVIYTWTLVSVYWHMSYDRLSYWKWWTTGPVGDGIIVLWPVVFYYLWYEIIGFETEMTFVLSKTSSGSWH